MLRRDFLKATAPLLAAPVVINGVGLRAFAAEKRWYGAAAMLAGNNSVLVIIQLEGGNDGLNTVIPVEDDRYYNLRPTLGIAHDTALPLAGQSSLRFHPSMPGMRSMFDEGRLAIVQNIGYPNATLSHFASTEIWNTGSGGGQNEYQRTGWIGRYLQREFPDYPNVLPSDPPAIEIGGATSSLFTVVGSSIGMSLADPIEFYDLVNGGPHVGAGSGDPSPAGRELDYIATIDRQSQAYAEAIRNAAKNATNHAAYPDTSLAASLAIVARLIAGGLATRVYKVKLGNFDTHYGQLDPHARLLDILSGAVKAFQDDLIALHVDDRVVGMTYSEFGRRPHENGTGTDHGTVAPHFVFGSAVQGGTIHGGMADLGALDDSGNLPFTYDFHCYYASVIAPLFALNETALAEVLPLGVCASADRIPLFRQGTFAVPARRGSLEVRSVAVYPNPARDRATVAVSLPRAGHIALTLSTVDGRVVREIAADDIPAGTRQYALDCSGLASGDYVVALRGAGAASTAKLSVVR